MCVKIEIIWYDFFSADNQQPFIYCELIKAERMKWLYFCLPTGGVCFTDSRLAPWWLRYEETVVGCPLTRQKCEWDIKMVYSICRKAACMSTVPNRCFHQSSVEVILFSRRRCCSVASKWRGKSQYLKEFNFSFRCMIPTSRRRDTNVRHFSFLVM